MGEEEEYKVQMPRENLLLLLSKRSVSRRKSRRPRDIGDWKRNETNRVRESKREMDIRDRHPSSCHLTLQFEGNPRRSSSNSEAGHRLPLRNEISICRNELMHHEFALVIPRPRSNCILPLKEPAFDPVHLSSPSIPDSHLYRVRINSLGVN